MNEMIRLHEEAVTLKNGTPRVDGLAGRSDDVLIHPGTGTIAYDILEAHCHGKTPGRFNIKFDSLISHDITYVGIIQSARASGLKEFPLPYALTNCHNSLCAVGGTINEDDHAFGLSAAKKYGGIYVPANQAVLHQYAREMMAVGGGMILGSDSHTRYGALGTMGVGEGGPELVKQLLGNTYDINAPEVVLVWLTGSPPQGVGPHDIAVALCGAVYDNGFVKNKVLEFAGPGVAMLPMDFRIGVDVMTTETACLSSIWQTDSTVLDYYKRHGRGDLGRLLTPVDGARYHSMITVDLSLAEPMIAVPFHPSNAYTIREMNEHASDILREVEKDARKQFGDKASLSLTDKIEKAGGKERVKTDQGIIAGCAGGMYDNIAEAAAILCGHSVGDGYFSLSVYPPSVPVSVQLMEAGITGRLIEAGTLFKPCFCGPCFGAGDVPANNGFSIRHTTRNFANREGARPGDGQLAAVALMDARSIAATARNGGLLTSASEIEYDAPDKNSIIPSFHSGIYEKRVYAGFGKPDDNAKLRFGPNITDWPIIPSLGESILLRLDSVIPDPVTTTDELIPSGETSSYRSNPMKLAEFTLSRRDPGYVDRAKNTHMIHVYRDSRNEIHIKNPAIELPDLDDRENYETRVPKRYSSDPKRNIGESNESVQIGSVIFANKPGDGSAREQAASCQRVLGGAANVCREYATKRYRSNLINWGMLPFTLEEDAPFDAEVGDFIYIPDVCKRVRNGETSYPAILIPAYNKRETTELTLHIAPLTAEEREILLAGCLMNYYRNKSK